MLKKSADKWVALSVIACSVILFIALAFGLTGRTFAPGGHQVRVRFHDVTGIKVSSQVKYAGAPAGTVSAVRMLTAEERATDPRNMVEVTLALLPDVPPVPKDAKVSVAADTLLSDKFVLINAGQHDAPYAEAGDVLQGIAPTTFDQLARNTDDAIESLRRTLGGGSANGTDDIISRAQNVLGETEALLTDLKPVVQDARAMMTDARVAAADARKLLSDNKARIQSTLDKLDSATTAIESLAKRSESLVRDNEKNLNRTFADFKVTSENLKISSTYAKFLLQDLSQRPNRLIWGGGKAPSLPSEQKILEARQPIPAP